METLPPLPEMKSNQVVYPASDDRTSALLYGASQTHQVFLAKKVQYREYCCNA